MSRAGYDDYCDGWELIQWRGAVTSALRGKRGQAFLKEMLEALDALPEKRLIDRKFSTEGEVCALGAVAVKRGLDTDRLNHCSRKAVAETFGIARAMAIEIMWENDDGGAYWVITETPENRFNRIYKWVEIHIK